MSNSTTNVFTSMHYIYASKKSPSGYVIANKMIKGSKSDPVWCCPSHDQAEQWIAHQVLMHQRQAAIDSGMTKKEAVATITLDTTTTSSYNEETTKKAEDTTMNIESMNLVELAALQMEIANRIHSLLTSDNNNTNTTEQSDTNAVTQVEALQPEVVAAPSVEPQESVPSNAPAEQATTPKKRVVKSKKVANVEAVAEKIEATLCAMSRDEARSYIKEHKLPIKGNMSCENLNDAINAFNQGGIECVPVAYLTKAAAEKVAKGFAKQAAKEAVTTAKRLP